MANALRVGDHLLERLGARARRARMEVMASMKTTRRSPTDIGKGLLAGLAGTAAMTVSSTIEAKLRGRAVQHGAGPTPPPRRSGSRSSTDDAAQARFSTSCTGATAPAGASPAACCARSASRRGAATPAHFGAVWGSALVTLPALEVAPPVTMWGGEEVAIDVFHHLVYVAATGLAYELLDRSDHPRRTTCNAGAVGGSQDGQRAAAPNTLQGGSPEMKRLVIVLAALVSTLVAATGATAKPPDLNHAVYTMTNSPAGTPCWRSHATPTAR